MLVMMRGGPPLCPKIPGNRYEDDNMVDDIDVEDYDGDDASSMMVVVMIMKMIMDNDNDDDPLPQNTRQQIGSGHGGGETRH